MRVRVGLHCGPATSGVLGDHLPHWAVFGRTVVLASRMESSGEAGRVQASAAFAATLRGGLAGGVSAEALAVLASTEALADAASTEVLADAAGACGGFCLARREAVAASARCEGDVADSFQLTRRVPAADVKGVGMMETYWIEAAVAAPS